MKYAVPRMIGMLTLASWLGGCAFYISLLGYPSAPEPREFSYYDANFGTTNGAALQASRLRLEGYYCNRDTTQITHNEQQGGSLIHRQSSTYRYLKFFADGRVVSMFTADPPDSAIHQTLRRAPWFLTGYFKVAGDTIHLEFKQELRGNRSYFEKAVATTNGVRKLVSQPKKPLWFLEYQYLPD